MNAQNQLFGEYQADTFKSSIIRFAPFLGEDGFNAMMKLVRVSLRENRFDEE